MISSTKRLAVFLLGVFIIIGAILVRSSIGTAATTWMLIYKPSDAPTNQALLNYLHHLRVPIPPIISTLEMITYRFTGTTDLVTIWFYRASMVVTYSIAIILSAQSVYRLVISFSLSVVFLWATVLVHPGNPQIYDILFPMFMLLYLLGIRILGNINRDQQFKTSGLSFLTGFTLTMAELSRPFGVFLLPLLLIHARQALAHLPRRYSCYLLVPLIVLSGGWHIHYGLYYRQLTWSNHSGFNIHRAWSMVPVPALIPEVHNQPLAPDRWANLNTAEHTANSLRLQRAVIRYILQHPLSSMAHGFSRVATLLSAQTSLYGNAPSHSILKVYKLSVALASVLLMVNILILSVYVVAAKKQCFQLLVSTDNIVIITTFLVICFLALAESGEEARFLLSVLPLFAILPQAHTLNAAQAERQPPL